jgi:hypothetical protein
MKNTFLVIVAAFLIMASCSKGGAGGGGGNGGGGGGGGGTVNCTGVASAFAANVNPIIQSSCAIATCHDAGSINGPGPLLTYNQIFNARVAIKTAVGNGTMPKTGSITAAQKNSIICWVDAGGPNN